MQPTPTRKTCECLEARPWQASGASTLSVQPPLNPSTHMRRSCFTSVTLESAQCGSNLALSRTRKPPNSESEDVDGVGASVFRDCFGLSARSKPEFACSTLGTLIPLLVEVSWASGSGLRKFRRRVQVGQWTSTDFWFNLRLPLQNP